MQSVSLLQLSTLSSRGSITSDDLGSMQQFKEQDSHTWAKLLSNCLTRPGLYLEHLNCRDVLCLRYRRFPMQLSNT